MNQTTNYQLPQWEAMDVVKRGDFNDAMSKLDAALKANAEAAASAAGSAQAAQDSAAGAGNCIVKYGTYTGTGTNGASGKNTLTFDFCPVAVYIHAISQSSNSIHLLRGVSSTIGLYGGLINMSWADNSVSWYADSHADEQLNVSGQRYACVAIGYSL